MLELQTDGELADVRSLRLSVFQGSTKAREFE